MRTDIIKVQQTETKKQYTSSFSAPQLPILVFIIKEMFSSVGVISQRGNQSNLETKSSFEQILPKTVELERQLNRLRAAIKLAEAAREPLLQTQELELCISFLRKLVTGPGPIPVPVASWSSEAGTSLFFDQDGRYGDLEITSGSEVEYYLKWNDGDREFEVYGLEKLEYGSIPHKLLASLYAMFARYDDRLL